MKTALTAFRQELDAIREAGTWRTERIITTPQRSSIATTEKPKVVNLCANNYLGLSDHPALIEAAKASYDRWGFGLSSVRFICGTQEIHKELEGRIARFLGMEDAILYSSCFDANGGLFETLLGPEDAIISDELNHASIIDGVRLCKAKRFRYANNDMADLEAKLQEADAAGARVKLISTDGVFSMDGIIAQLDKIHELAARYNAIVHFDDCHATGFLGKRGRGTHEYRGLFGNIDITTGTLGKALGGASGGYVSGPKEVVDVLRQKARPYLFSNSVAPAIVAASIKVLDLLEQSTEARDRVEANTKYFRDAMTAAGFTIGGKDHPISPVMLGDAVLSQNFSAQLLDEGVYAVGFFYPVVPKGQARIRTQISAAHTREQLDKAIEAFCKVGKNLGVIS